MTALLDFSLLFHPLGPSSGHLEPGFWIYVSLSLCARDSVFDDLGTWILDADHGRLVILEFGSWIFLEGILGARVILDLGSHAYELFQSDGKELYSPYTRPFIFVSLSTFLNFLDFGGGLETPGISQIALQDLEFSGR